jgi:hypothetical protein
LSRWVAFADASEALAADRVLRLEAERRQLAVALDVETVAAARVERGARARVDALGADGEPLLVLDTPTLLADE